MRFEGILKSWNDERGFGFLEPLQSNEDVFVHVKAFRAGVARPQVGQAVSFEIEVGPQGKKRATNVELIGATRVPRRQPQTTPVPKGRVPRCVLGDGDLEYRCSCPFVLANRAVLVITGLHRGSAVHREPLCVRYQLARRWA